MALNLPRPKNLRQLPFPLPLLGEGLGDVFVIFGKQTQSHRRETTSRFKILNGRFEKASEFSSKFQFENQVRSESSSERFHRLESLFFLVEEVIFDLIYDPINWNFSGDGNSTKF